MLEEGLSVLALNAIVNIRAVWIINVCACLLRRICENMFGQMKLSATAKLVVRQDPL